MAPLNQYTKESTAEDVSEGLDLGGQIALVTGGTAGIGLETVRVLALRGAHVLATGRSLAKVEQACQGIAGKVTPLALELTDLDSVNRCAARVVEQGLTPTIVICNAGMMNFGELELVAGIEKQFFANFLGHFVLVNNLLPAMLAQGVGRFVHVSSDTAYKDSPKSRPREGIDFDNLRGEGLYDGGQAYGRSKLANALFSFALARRLKGTGLTSNALHPGSVLTNISHSAPAEIRQQIAEWAHRLRTVEQGAATQVYLATSPDLNGVSGRFFEVCNPVNLSFPHFLYDPALAEKLWCVAEEMAGEYL